jgi:hypothetical protein
LPRALDGARVEINESYHQSYVLFSDVSDFEKHDKSEELFSFLNEGIPFLRFLFIYMNEFWAKGLGLK